MSYKIRCSKNSPQSIVTIVQDDNTDISGLTSVTANVYSDDLSTTVNTYTLTAQDIIDLKAGSVNVSTLDLIGSAAPDDDFYSVELDGDTVDSDLAGIGITLEAKGETYNKQGFVDVYDPDFRIDQVLHTAHMLVQEMDNIENQDSTLQKRIDFTTRLATLKKILSYE